MDLPKPMAAEVARIIRERPELGFDNEGEFIREAMRRSILIYGRRGS